MARRHFQWAARLLIAAAGAPLMYFTFKTSVDTCFLLVLGGSFVAVLEYTELRKRILGGKNQHKLTDSCIGIPVFACSLCSTLAAYNDAEISRFWRSLYTFFFWVLLPTWSLILPNVSLKNLSLRKARSASMSNLARLTKRSHSRTSGDDDTDGQVKPKTGNQRKDDSKSASNKRPSNPRLKTLATDMLLTITLCNFDRAFLKLRRINGASGTLGVSVLVFAVMTPWIADAFALFFGGRFGKRRIVPALSPNKTLEGFLAMIPGAFASTIGMRYYGLYIAKDFVFTEFYRITPLNYLLLLSVLAASAGAVGDLLESSLKRLANVKDTGTAFGAHGGLLDRLDSVSFSVMCMAAILT